MRIISPQSQRNKCEIIDIYDKEEAINIIKLADEEITRRSLI
jgi:hypothetical protein